jgi:hypothetical protein
MICYAKVGSILGSARALVASAGCGSPQQGSGGAGLQAAAAVTGSAPSRMQLGAACVKERKRLMELTAGVGASKKEILRISREASKRSASSRSGWLRILSDLIGKDPSLRQEKRRGWEDEWVTLNVEFFAINKQHERANAAYVRQNVSVDSWIEARAGRIADMAARGWCRQA